MSLGSVTSRGGVGADSSLAAAVPRLRPRAQSAPVTIYGTGGRRADGPSVRRKGERWSPCVVVVRKGQKTNQQQQQQCVPALAGRPLLVIA